MDKMDYIEPRCPLCDGKDFFEPDGSPKRIIPIDRVIDKLDRLINENKSDKITDFLDYWCKEARLLNDKRALVEFLSEEVGHFRRIGEAKKGKSACLEAISLIDELELAQTISGATVLLNCATTLKAFGDFDYAISIYSRVAEVYQKKLDKDDILQAGLYNNMGLALVDAGEYHRAFECYDTALNIATKCDKHNELAITYVNMAHLYENLNEHDKINECLSKAIKALNSPEINQDAYHAYVCTNCASSFGYFGYDIVQNMLTKRASKIYERN